MISWPWELCEPLRRALEDTTRCPPMVSWNKSCRCRILTMKWLPDFVLLQSTLDFQVVLLASPISCNGFEMTFRSYKYRSPGTQAHSKVSHSQAKLGATSLPAPASCIEYRPKGKLPRTLHGRPFATGGIEGSES